MYIKLLIITLIIQQIRSCELLIQKFELSEQYIIIQSECKLKEILEIDTEKLIDFTYLSDNQIMISTSTINEESEYEIYFIDSHEKQKTKIIQNTDSLKPIQEKVNEQGVQSRYNIVVENLKIDIFSAIIKGLALIFL